MIGLALLIVACGRPVEELEHCDPTEVGQMICVRGVIFVCEPSASICAPGTEDGQGGCTEYRAVTNVWLLNGYCAKP